MNALVWRSNGIQDFTELDADSRRFLIVQTSWLPARFRLELRQHFPKQPSKVRTLRAERDIKSRDEAKALAQAWADNQEEGER